MEPVQVFTQLSTPQFEALGSVWRTVSDCVAAMGEEGKREQVLKLGEQVLKKENKTCFNPLERVAPSHGDIKISGPDTVFQGDEVVLRCEAGPSHPGLSLDSSQSFMRSL